MPSRFVTAALAFLFSAHPGIAEPWRLEEAVHSPEWLTLKGESRIRYESLEGQFRAGRDGSDQLLLFRSLLQVEADTGALKLGVELQDSRTYLGDDGTPLSSSILNPLDFLQVYALADDLPGLLGDGSQTRLKIGRQTVSIGSKRQIERVDFANVIKSYTGAHLVSTSDRGDELHLLYVVPTARFPNTRPDLDDNNMSGDEEQWERRIWGAHYRRTDIFAAVAPGVWGEVFVYGLEERDSGDFQTPDRSYVSPGIRLYRKPRLGQWDIDLEGALRKGSRYATSRIDDTQGLDVDASMLFAALGYTFEHPWKTRFAFEYYYASGDEDPDDFSFNQHERLFGSRRSDLNNTSLHGPLTPANLNAPGFRIEVKPHERWDARFYYHAAHLASDTDSWVIASKRDVTGSSGNFIGHTLDGRARYWVVPENVRLELGASALIPGEFSDQASPNGNAETTVFGYAQMTVHF